MVPILRVFGRGLLLGPCALILLLGCVGLGGARPPAPTTSAARVADTSRGLLLVANKSAGTVSVLQPTSGAVAATLPTGEGPHEIAVSRDGRRALITNYGSTGAPGSSVTLFDLEGLRPLRTISLGEHRRPHGVAWLDEGRTFVVTSETSHALIVVDVANGPIAAIPTGQETSHMVVVSPERRHAYVANIDSGSVTMIDLVRREAVRTTETGKGAEGIDVSPRGDEVWVTNRSANTLSVLDAHSLEPRATIPTGSFPIRVKFTPDGRRALVTHARASELRIFDTHTRVELAAVRFPLDRGAAVPTMFGDRFGESAIPIGLLVTSDGRTAFVATAATDEIVEVDLERATILRRLRAGREPDGLGWVSRP